MTTVDLLSKEQTESRLALKADLTALNSGLATKQDTLVSGTNIKTINGSSILGSGNISIQGSGSVTLTDMGGYFRLNVE